MSVVRASKHQETQKRTPFKQTWQCKMSLARVQKFSFQFAAKTSPLGPSDIRIIETDDTGRERQSGLTFGDTETQEFDAEDDEERGGWDNKLDFLFSCISVSVGLGSEYTSQLLSNVHFFRFCMFQMSGDFPTFVTRMAEAPFSSFISLPCLPVASPYSSKKLLLGST